MTERAPALHGFIDALRREIIKTGTTEEEMAIIDVAAEHPYECKCDTCLKYWELVGPEHGPE